jgi:D-glycero-D-manno-heptose 1,7-bisphosphate phosphatase
MKLIILDRDGTINEDRDDFVKSVDEWIALPFEPCRLACGGGV